MNKGSELLMEPKPRIRMVCEDPGWPEFWVTCTPAARPCNACSVLRTGMLVASLMSTVVTAPEILLRCWFPYPMTTASSKPATSGFKVTVKSETVFVTVNS